MNGWRRSSRAPLSLALALSACTSWRVETDPLPAPLDGRTMSVVRVLTRNGETIVVYEARLSGDSIIGLERQTGTTPRRIAIAVDNVARLERRSLDLWRTIYTPVAVFAMTVVLAALVAAVTCQPA
jgi:hypothetical protein